MELESLHEGRDMTPLLMEMGIRYDPARLSKALKTKWPQVYGRALFISSSIGGFITQVAADKALGLLEKNTALRAGQLRDLLGSLG